MKILAKNLNNMKMDIYMYIRWSQSRVNYFQGAGARAAENRLAKKRSTFYLDNLSNIKNL